MPSFPLLASAALLAFVLAAAPAGATTYHLVDLGESTEAFAIDRKGEVVGDAWSDYIPESAKLTANWTYPWVCGNCEKPRYGASVPAGL